MKMFKVITRVDLTIESKSIFWSLKKYDCYFTWNTKYVYANNLNDAKRKYRNYFFSSIKSNDSKYTLSALEFCYNTKSNNMNFNLKFNDKIISVDEQLIVCELGRNDNIDLLKRNSLADDFRDWFMNFNIENTEED